MLAREISNDKKKKMHHDESFKVEAPSKMFTHLQQLNVPLHDSSRFQQDQKNLCMIEQNTPTSSKSSITKMKKKGNTIRSHDSKHNKFENKEHDN